MKFGYFHVERQPLRQQHQDTERLCRQHNRRGGLRRGSGSAFGLDRRASLQHLGLLSCPDLVLANVAARTRQIRLAPAVTVLPLHHPIRVAEQWATLDLLSAGRVDFAAGRGYGRREYLPLNVSFEDNQEIFEEGMEVVQRLWSSDAPISHHGKDYRFENIAITPQPLQRPTGWLNGCAMSAPRT